MEENVQVKAVEGTENVSTQEKEAAVLQEAIEAGEVDSNYGFQDDGVYRVNVDSPPKQKEDAIQEQETTRVSMDEPAGDSEKVDEEVRVENTEEPSQEEEVNVLEEVIEEVVEENVVEQKTQSEQQEISEPEQPQQIEYPEDIQKLISFMEETGGGLEDYVNLNRDYSKMDNTTLVFEYLKNTKPHLDNEDINFLMQKEFAYDEEVAEQSEVKAKQLAFKERLYEAQTFFNSSKEKYYADLKLRKQTDIPDDYKKAYEFYNEAREYEEQSKKAKEIFDTRSEKFFQNDFKGFDFKVGEKKYRFKVDNTEKVKTSQSSIENFITPFLNKDGHMERVGDYHKALFAANNADKIANHFYEQGRADAIKEAAAKSKNIDMSPRTDNSAIAPTDNKVRVVQSDSSDRLRIKWK